MNMTLIVGNIGKIDKKHTTKGAVINADVAVSSSYTRNGQTYKETTWFTVSIWGPLQNRFKDSLHVGQLILVKGKIRTSVWLDKDKHPHATLDLFAQELCIL